MDDIGSAVDKFEDLIPSLTKIFECVRKSGLKLSANKCEFGAQKVTFLGKIITPAGIQPESERIKKFEQTNHAKNSKTSEKVDWISANLERFYP